MSKDFFVIAHNIRSLFNVGSIFRTADAFGVTKLFLTGYTGQPPDSKIAKVALGAEEYMPWQYSRSPKVVIKQLRTKHQNLQVVGLENNIKNKKTVLLNKFHPKFPLALILGEEVDGVSKNLLDTCDVLVEIPMLGAKESLNVSVAFGVACYAIINHQ